MADITIRKLNETWLKVSCSEVYQELDIQDRFSFEIPNAKHDPRVKKGHWDGIKKLYDRRTGKIYLGLLLELLEFCDKQGFSVDLDPALIPDDEDALDFEDVQHLVESFIQPKDKNGNLIEVYDYQYDAVLYMLNMKRTVCLSATSSGKSLMIYLAVRIYQLLDGFEDKTIFITVPSINLVNQMYADFEQYSQGTNWHVSKFCQRIASNRSKRIEKQIVITTWQSQKNLPYDEFERIGAIFIDECHGAKANVLSGILESLTQCQFKHGLTGTLDDVECNELVIQGLLGPAKRIVTAKEIMDAGRASNVKVNMLLLNHNKETCQSFKKFSNAFARRKGQFDPKSLYEAEVQFLNSFEDRLEFILNMIEELDGNTLVMFDRVEKYGEILYERFKARRPNSTFLIVGKVDGDEREEIRLDIENYNDAVVWASYGTMSTGVSINRLHNCVLISSSKSKIRVLQTIGRMMRMHSSKNDAYIYDIVDNLQLSETDRENYTMQHAQKRIEFYTKEHFDLEFLNLNL